MMIINSTIKDFLKKKNSKGERTSDKDIKSLMKKERKKVSVSLVNIIKNILRNKSSS